MSDNLISSVGVLPKDILVDHTVEIQDLLAEIDKSRKIYVQNKHILKCVNEVVFIDKTIPTLIDKVNAKLKRDYYFNQFNTDVPFLDLDESESVELSNSEKIQLRLEVCKKIKSKSSMSQLKISRELFACTNPMDMLNRKQNDATGSVLGAAEYLMKCMHSQWELLNLKKATHEHVEGYKGAMDNTIKLVKEVAEWKHSEKHDNITSEVVNLECKIRYLELTIKSYIATETPLSVAAVRTNLQHMEQDIRANESLLADLKRVEATYSEALKTEEYNAMFQKYRDLRTQIEYMKWACQKFSN